MGIGHSLVLHQGLVEVDAQAVNLVVTKIRFFVVDPIISMCSRAIDWMASRCSRTPCASLPRHCLGPKREKSSSAVTHAFHGPAVRQGAENRGIRSKTIGVRRRKTGCLWHGSPSLDKAGPQQFP